jgi:cytochrome P450
MTNPGLIGGRDHFNDFDLDSKEFAEHYDEVIDALLEKCPVAHGKANGGYWVVSRAEDFKKCAQDYETFTSTLGFEPAHSNEGEGAVKLYPLQIDPPYQTKWRSALGPFFSARAVVKYQEDIRGHVNFLVDGFIEQGRCDFVDAFAAQLPGRVFFGSFLGVSFDDLPVMQKASDDAIRGPADGRAAAWIAVGEFLANYLTTRANEPPRGDFVDVVLRGVAMENGEPCPFEHKMFTMVDFLAGGTGTAAHTLACMAYHLATHPGDVARLTDEPELRANLVEEIIRVYAPVFALGRTATRDTEIAGQPIAMGDLVMLSEGAACRDPRVAENPTMVDLDRKVPLNLAFSCGPHRCIGANVARLEMLTALEVMLCRLPDLALAPGSQPVYSNSGVARTMDKLKVVFTPGKRAEAPA